jgi:hypothetical protein
VVWLSVVIAVAWVQIAAAVPVGEPSSRLVRRDAWLY